MFTHFSGRTKQPAKCVAYFCALAILICLKFALNKQPKPKCDRKHTQTHTHTHTNAAIVCACLSVNLDSKIYCTHTERMKERAKPRNKNINK